MNIPSVTISLVPLFTSPNLPQIHPDKSRFRYKAVGTEITLSRDGLWRVSPQFFDLSYSKLDLNLETPQPTQDFDCRLYPWMSNKSGREDEI